MADLWRAKGDQFFDSNGDPLNGGRFRYYDAETTSPRTVYQDSEAATPWTQPIALDSAGRLTASIYVPTGAFKERLSTSADVDIYTEDNIPGAITIPDADFARPDTPVITKASNYTVAAADFGALFGVDATGGDFTLTLLSAVTAGDGATIYVQQIGAGGKTTIAPGGGQTINGASSIALFRQYSGVKITSDGANWSAIATDFPFSTLAKTTTYTITLADFGKLLLGDATSASFVITLPTVASAGAGFVVGVKKTDASANTVTLDGNGAETIDGAADFVLNGQHEAIIVRCTGSAWHIETHRAASAAAGYSGLVELATVAEAGAGTDTARAVTPAGLYPAEADVASATTTAIGAATTSKVRITGTTTITGFGTVAAGITRKGRFAGVLTLTHNASSLILPGSANITTAANDRFEAVSLGSGNWFVYTYQRATGGPVFGDTNYQVFTSSGTWTKPLGLTASSRVYVEAWGAGGGGGADATGGAGAGGGYREGWFLASALGATETVTIAAGGAVNTAGGNSTLGAHLTAYGGGAGANATQGGGGGGGGLTGAGANGATTVGGNGGALGGGAATGENSLVGGGGGGDTGDDGGDAVFGGGGGGAGNGNNTNAGDGGNSVFGGGGGGGGTTGSGSPGSGGVSVHAGNGGNMDAAGSAPAGGGGKNAAGGRGEIRVTTFP